MTRRSQRPPVTRSQLVVAQRHLAGHEEHALHGAPPVVLVGSAHAVHLALPADRVAVLLAGHAQEDVGAHVLEAHRLVALPMVAVALHRPRVQGVALAILPEGADLLVVGQGGDEVVCVEVAAGLHVCDADGLATLDGDAALTRPVGLPTDLPVTVGIVCVFNSSYRLLPTA